MRKPITPERLAKLNRRQRKKYHAGEFQELVFVFEVRFRAAMSDTEQDAFLDAFFDFVEARNLGASACTSLRPVEMITGMVGHFSRGSATEADRQALLEWLQTWPGVESAALGELVDGWYGWDE